MATPCRCAGPTDRTPGSGSPSNSGPFLDAVLQLAIWKTEYGGSFDTLGLDSATQNSVNTALADTVFGGIDYRGDLTSALCTRCLIPTYRRRPCLLRIAAVPEPSTWAMMILGFCGIVVMGARNKRKNGNALERPVPLDANVDT